MCFVCSFLGCCVFGLVLFFDDCIRARKRNDDRKRKNECGKVFVTEGTGRGYVVRIRTEVKKRDRKRRTCIGNTGTSEKGIHEGQEEGRRQGGGVGASERAYDTIK